MSNFRIILKDPDPSVPSFYQDADGLYSFDLSDDQVALTKQIDDDTDVGKLRQDTVRKFSLPATKKNRCFLKDIGNPNAFNFDHNKKIKVELIDGDFVLINATDLRVTSLNFNTYEVEVTGEASNWIEPLSKIRISDLDFGGNVTFDRTLVENTFTNGDETYSDGGSPYFFPLVNYGRWRSTNFVSVEDFRFWFSPLHILREAFCRIGWTFVCPVLESDFGRRLWSYILREDWNNSGGVEANRGFLAELSSDLVYPGGTAPVTIVFDNDSVAPAFDDFNNYDNVTGEYKSNVEGDFVAELNIEVNNTTGVESFLLVDMRKINQFGDLTDEDQFTAVIPASTLSTYSVRLSLQNILTTDQDKVFVKIQLLGVNLKVFAGARFYNVPKKAIIQRGDILDPADLIDPELDPLSFLKGIVHLFNLKVDSDPTLKTVAFYPEDEAFLPDGTELEGFLLPLSDAIDVTDKIQKKSLKIDLKEEKRKRFLQLEFKADGTDQTVKNLDLDLPLYSKKIDFGDSFKEGVEKSTNPFFAPTANAIDETIGQSFGSPFPDNAPVIPTIWKADRNEDGSLPDQNNKIQPRIILAQKPGKLIYTPDGSNLSANGTFLFENVTYISDYPATGQIFPSGYRTDPTGVDPIRFIDECLVYNADEFNPDLSDNYEAFYLKALKRFAYSFPVELLVRLCLNDIANFSHRRAWFVKYFSENFGQIQFFGRVLKISDYVLNRDLTTPVTIQPNGNNFDISSCCKCEEVNIRILQTGSFGGLNYIFIADLIGDCPDPILNWSFAFISNGIFVGATDGQTVEVQVEDPGSNPPFINIFVNVSTNCGDVVKNRIINLT